MRSTDSRLRRWFHSHSRTLVSAGFAVALGWWSLWLLAPESRLGTSLRRSSYDWSQSLLPETRLGHSRVVIVYLDLASYLREKQNPTGLWSRALHARLLNRLTAAGAKEVVFDIIFDGIGPDVAADHEFARAIQANGKVVLAGEIGHSGRDTTLGASIESLQLSRPEGLFLRAAAAWGAANLNEDSDFVVRRFFPGFTDPSVPSLTTAAAKLAGVPAAGITPAQWLRYYGRPFAIPHVSYSAALRTNEVSDAFFRDRIVFIGARPMSGTYLQRRDEFRSPFASWGAPDLFMPAVEVQATQLLNLLRGDSLRRLSLRAEGLVLSGAALLLVGLLFRFRPLPAAGLAAVAEVLVLGGARLALADAQTWFPWLIVEAVQIPAALGGSVLWQSAQWYRQRRMFEARRRADEAKIREQAALIEKAQDAILVQEIPGRIVHANPAAERLYGWSAGELMEATLPPILAPDEPHLAEARRTALATGEWLGELAQTARDGRKFTVASHCTLIRDESGRPKLFLFVNTDVTEKKRLELELFRAQRMESVGSFVGGIAHDLNNAFAPVLMGLQLLRQKRQDEETQRMLSLMEQNTHRGADMVRQVLLFCRGRDGEKEILPPGRLMGDLEHLVRQTFPKSINVAALVPADLWPVMGNATQLHQVLLNLCVNARDAMSGGGELTLAADNVELSAEEAGRIPNGAPGRFVMLLVSDTGCGIPPELMPRIYEPFFTTKPVDRGTGLGLSIVARIVAQHGGFINVRSELGHGTIFEIYLPRAEGAPAAEAKRRSPSDFPRGGGEWILVADDEQAVLEMVSLTLGDVGYRVLTAANGAEAVARFESHAGEVRLALLDADMPVLDGPQTIAKLRDRAPNLPVLLMSGQGDTNVMIKNVGTMTKPFQVHELLDAVARRVGRV